MFAFGSGSSSLAAGKHDPTQERKAPPFPTSLTLPNFVTPDRPQSSWQQGSAPALSAILAGLRKPSDIHLDHLASFNVSIEADSPYRDLISTSSPDLAFFPDSSWSAAEDPDESESMSLNNRATLSNGRKVPNISDFRARLSELRLPNEDAFSALTRVPRDGKKPPRLVHLRRFWEGLDNMAYYWDTSLDEYISPPASPLVTPTEDKAEKAAESVLDRPPESEPRKKPRIFQARPSTSSIHPAFDFLLSPRSTLIPQRSPPPPGRSSSDPGRRWNLQNGTYKGNRIGNGSNMPETYRAETVRAFMEAVCWAFGITFAPHRRHPLVQVENVRFPIRVTNVGWRAPLDRAKARSGYLEGPIIGIQCRPDLDFGSSESAGRLDATREFGGLLCLAQERARAGKTERKPGEGKWWTTVPRWGGGPGGDVGEATGASDDPSIAKDAKPDIPTKVRGLRGEKRRLNPVQIWETLKPGMSIWDPKVKYEAVGRKSGDPWDEVYMVSSVKHHLRILKLRVHEAYLEYVLDGTLPTTPPADSSWNAPTIDRTRWYDLFNADDRVEAMAAVWGVVGYLMRTQEQPDGGMDTTA